MSDEKVDVLAAAARLFEAADWDGLRALFAEEAVLMSPEGWPEPGPFVGRAAIVEQFQRLKESWGTNRVVIEEHAERDDWLVVRMLWAVEGAASGVPGEMTFFNALRFEDGQIAEYRGYTDRDEALEAAGLSE